MTERCVVIGNGTASVECIKAARRSGYKGEIHVISDVDHPPLNPTLVTYYASGKIDYDGLFPFGNNLDFYDQNRVVRHFGAPVESLDTEKHVVRIADGQETLYDKCVIAAGASPILPSVFSGKALTLRTVKDAVRFKELLGYGKKRVLVVGASMVGVKAVEACANAGFDVRLADMEKSIFPLAAHENCSELIHKILEDRGVNLLFGKPVEADEIEMADDIIVCTGTAPNTSFVDHAKIKTGPGILVNEYTETSAEDVYAAGDIAQGPGLAGGKSQIIGLYSNAYLQGRTAGRNIAGVRTKYAGTIPHNMTTFFGHDFFGIGDVRGGDEVYENIDDANKRYIRIVFKDKALIGVNLLNIPEISGILKYHLTKSLLKGEVSMASIDESLALNRLYGKFPDIEKFFLKMR